MPTTSVGGRSRLRVVDEESVGREISIAEAVVLQAGDGIAVTRAPSNDDEPTLVFVNDALCRLIRFERAELLGRTPGLFVGDPTDTADLDEVASQVEQGDTARFELSLHRRDGSPVWAEATCFAARGADDQPPAYVAIYRELDPGGLDEQRYRTLVENTTDLIAVLDGDLTIRYINPGAGALLGRETTEVVGRSAAELVRADRRPELESWLEGVLGSGQPAAPRELEVVAEGIDDRVFEFGAIDRLDDPSVGGLVLSARDVTDRIEARDQLRSSERRFRALVQHSADSTVVLDPDGRVRYASPAAERILGLPAGDDLSDDLLGAVDPIDLEQAQTFIRRALSEPGLSGPVELTLSSEAGGRTVELVANNLLHDADIGGVVLNGRDVTSRRRAQTLMRDQAVMLEEVARGLPLEVTLERIASRIERSVVGSHCLVGVADGEHLRLASRPGLPAEIIEVLESPTGPLGSVDILLEGQDSLTGLIDSDPAWSSIAGPLADTGLIARWIMPLRSPGSANVLGALVVFHPQRARPHPTERQLFRQSTQLAALAIERHRFEAALEHQALHDELTDLPNRTLVMDRIEQGVARLDRRETGMAVLFVDLDRFKVINDSRGHAEGDRLLREVAARLQRPLRSGDTVGRLGGDEFVMICDEIVDEGDAVTVAERLASELAAPVDLDGAVVHVSASIGIALAWSSDTSAETLIANADLAMYRAKEEGRDRYALFEEDLHRNMVTRHELEAALHVALAQDELILHYQPQIRLRDGRITAVEALVRWERPGHGMLPPGQFIQVAEETGLIVPLGNWVIDQSLRDAAAWPVPPTGEAIAMTINLSARQLASSGLIDNVVAALDRHQVPPSRVVFEVTESALVDDMDTAVTTLNRLKDLGVRIAIDDFGTGHATFDYLRRFSMADSLKVDRSFVEGLDGSAVQDRAIVSASLVLADSLGLKSVAEGVETPEQLEVLRTLGCDMAQGYLFSRPVPLDEAVALTDQAAHWI
ncbi:MAG: EAL domain-containing protein [Actinomycetia bacterium]|nr:EAL domain-containing protein [Actinomycetes bacterium]